MPRETKPKKIMLRTVSVLV